MLRFLAVLLLAPLLPLAQAADPAPPGSAATSRKAEPREIDWLEMIPADELKALEEMPMIDHSGGRMDQLFTSARTVTAMDGVRGKLPGYLVPIEGDAEGKVSEFFFVPYFGACLHMPPPPPNQIVYVKPAEPVDPGQIWDAFWIVGTLRVSRTENAMATSAYSFELEKLETMDGHW